MTKLGTYVSKTASKLLGGHLKLQMVIQTPRNSQRKMLHSVIAVPEEVLQKLDFNAQLSSYEMKLIGELCDELQPFVEITDHIQGLACVLIGFCETYSSKLVTSLQISER